MSNFADVFSDDAFSNLSLTAAINEVDHVPGQAGALAVQPSGAIGGIPTTELAIEAKESSLRLIKSTLRDAPAEQEVGDKPNLRKFQTIHFQVEDTIYPSQLQNGREFGSMNLRTVESEVMDRMAKIAARFDLTLENHRLGAVKGEIRDADGSLILNLFDAFGILNSDGQPAPEDFYFNLADYSTSAFDEAVRIKCHEVSRFMKRNLKMLTAGAPIFALCGDNFFDQLIEHPSVKGVYDGYGAAAERLGGNYTEGTFEFGGIFFVNYQPTDDNATVKIEAEEARFFFSGVPGLFTENFAPASTIDAVNSIGLPRYAAIAVDPEFGRWAKLRVESNPLTLCVRPKTLVRGLSSADSE